MTRVLQVRRGAQAESPGSPGPAAGTDRGEAADSLVHVRTARACALAWDDKPVYAWAVWWSVNLLYDVSQQVQ